MPVIQTRQLSKSVGETSILNQITLSLEAREQVALVGRSGSGKSTLLGLLAGLDLPSSGEVWLEGQPLHALSENARALLRRETVGFVFQSFQLLPSVSALQNVLLPLMLLANSSERRNTALTRTAMEAQAAEMLDRVGLAHRLHHSPSTLSGGEQQRVAIARALVHQPRLVFADEPTGNLDGKTAADIESLLFQLSEQQGTTLLMVTHDRHLAARCQRQLHLVDGELVENHGNPANNDRSQRERHITDEQEATSQTTAAQVIAR